MKKIVFIFLFILSSCELFFPPSVYEKLVEKGLINPRDIKAIYVSPVGNDYYPGTNKSEPVKTIDIAIQKAKQYGYDYIYVQSADFILNNGLNNPGVSITNVNNIKLIGGFDADFSKIIGLTYLNGIITGYEINNVIYISNSSNIRLENLKISGYNNNSAYQGCSIAIHYSTNISIKNCNLISNYVTTSSGAAIYIRFSSGVNTLNTVINYNINNAFNIIFIIFSSFCSIENCNIINNFGNTIIQVISSSNIFVGSKFYNNTNNSTAPFFYSINTNITISGEIYNNFQSGYSVDVNFLSLENNLNSKLFNLYMASNSYNQPQYKTNYVSLSYETNLTIQNCTFIGFGPDSNETAIYEQDDITGHRIINNRFRNMKNLYYNYPSLYINNTNELNDKYKTGASEAYGNITF